MRLVSIVLPLLIAAMLFYSCSNSDHAQSGNKSQSRHRKSNQHPTSGSSKDTLFIDSKSAVRATLDSIGLIKNKQKYGDTSIDAYTEDGSYYDYVADSILKRKKLQVIDAANYKFLKFIEKDGKATIIKVDTLSQVTTLFFFDPSRRPRIADVTDIENDCKNYFK
jgi:hypothetical protein